MSRFVGFFGDFRNPNVRAWLDQLVGGFLRCRMRYVREGNLALCVPENDSAGSPTVVEWRGLAGDFHLERHAPKAGGWSGRVWLRYEPELGRLTLGRTLDATETLYYARCSGQDVIVFSNALNPVLQLVGRKPVLSETGLLFYLTLWGIPAPWTAFQGIWKVGPGREVELELGGRIRRQSPGANLPRSESGRIPPELVRERLAAVVARLQSPESQDAVLLSGGMDSTVVATLICAGRNQRLPAYTLRYEKDPDLESLNWDYPYARTIAASLGLELREVSLDARTPAWAIAGYVLRHCDEPVADPAMVPLFLLASRARSEGIERLWDGRGGDDVLAFSGSGWKLKAWCLRWSPAFTGLRWLSGAFAGLCKAGGRRFHKWLDSDPARSALWASALLEPGQLTRLLEEANWEVLLDYHQCLRERSGERCPAGIAQRADWEIWFAEQNQRMADAMAKLVGVNLVSPFANEAFVRLLFSAPFSERVRGFGDKVLLRKAFRREIPRSVRRRPKRGLATPLSHWLNMGRPFVRCYVRRLRDYFGDGPLRWDEVKRWLRDPGVDPGVQWLLLTLILWLHSQVGEEPLHAPVRRVSPRQLEPV